MRKNLDKKDEVYYKVLDIVNTLPQTNQITDEELAIFKGMLRDNKYISTYIRALKLKMEDFKTFDDFIRTMDKHQESKSFADVVDYEIREALDSTWTVKNGIDPIKTMNYILDSAMAREGKICDFRDSVNPDKITGRCQNNEHMEVIGDNLSDYLTDEEQKEFDKINEKEGWNEAVDKFNDKFFPEEELELTLGQDVDINKFDDGDTYYVCSKCMEWVRENGDCEVSCDLG